MGLLINIQSLIRYIIFIPIIFIFSEAIVITHSYIKLRIKTNRDINTWKLGHFTIDDLNSLTPVEFRCWCGEFITKFGYDFESRTYNGIDIICTKGLSKTYIKCIRNEGILDSKICKELVGEMVHSSSDKGMIITSGTFGKSALQFIHSLPKEYDIQLLDGNDILEKYFYSSSEEPQIT